MPTQGGEVQEPCPPASTGSVERGVVNPRSRSCRGCLFYSSFLRDNNQNPTCYGFSRSIPDSYRTLDERGATKDFKYACLGYGVHKEATGSATSSSPNAKPQSHGELPLCVGIEFLADRRPVGHAPQKDEPDPHKHNPLTRPGANPSEDFTARFCRSASLVASAVVNNVIRVAATAKATVDGIFGSSDSKKSK
ncbi:hypothetical protein KC19_6G027400 [Ceratodon purpureus]|uniref:DUF8204 domain-containing protein n=1 Tax=Ceratodon purpureus TaxID=3225 RepID=A0A8T0HCA1_CERPU|nr:hypothetical protein KC19_6G027400 [Ceratodon purpureus]